MVSFELHLLYFTLHLLSVLDKRGRHEIEQMYVCPVVRYGSDAGYHFQDISTDTCDVGPKLNVNVALQ